MKCIMEWFSRTKRRSCLLKRRSNLDRSSYSINHILLSTIIHLWTYFTLVLRHFLQNLMNNFLKFDLLAIDCCIWRDFRSGQEDFFWEVWWKISKLHWQTCLFICFCSSSLDWQGWVEKLPKFRLDRKAIIHWVAFWFALDRRRLHHLVLESYPWIFSF